MKEVRSWAGSQVRWSAFGSGIYLPRMMRASDLLVVSTGEGETAEAKSVTGAWRGYLTNRLPLGQWP